MFNVQSSKLNSYAYYRLPRANSFLRLVQQNGAPLRIRSLEALNGRQGFVIAPFAITDDCPLLLMQPDIVEEVAIDLSPAQSMFNGQSSSQKASHPSPTYHIDFSNFHAHLETGEFRKLVLARCDNLKADHPVEPEQLFLRACQMYPRQFIALVSSPACGTWLMATPEILLENNGTQWKTIALAGTMQLQDEQLAFDNPPQPVGTRADEQAHIAWSIKNIQEQRYVATYMVETLEHFSSDISEEGPYTARAGHLVHLRSDFNFTLPTNHRLGSLLNALHPTPAVCGLPKREAFRFICGNEFAPRRYYSGFMGPLRMKLPGKDSAAEATHLYVSLRCMEIQPGNYQLHAGGGLLRDSVEQQEWDETEAKMETMRNLIHYPCIATKKT